jgi:cytochrome P450
MSAHDDRGHPITNEEIKDNILLVLSAGLDSTSSALGVVLKYLFLNPHCLQEVIKGNSPFCVCVCVCLVYNNLALLQKCFERMDTFFNQVILFIPTKNICVKLSTFLFFFLY